MTDGKRLALARLLRRIANELEAEAVSRPRVTRGAVAADWLAERFREKREWPSTELFGAAKAAEISRAALCESAEVSALPILKRKRTRPSGETAWWWVAEQGWPAEAV
jgi:hypothetical protein